MDIAPDVAVSIFFCYLNRRRQPAAAQSQQNQKVARKTKILVTEM